MKRREFITLLGAAAVAPSFLWTLVARAQQERTRRIGVLLGTTQTGPEPVPAFVQELRRLGWTEGRDVRIEYRAVASDIERFRTYAAELVGLMPDVILVQSNPGLAALQQVTRTIPIVFVQVADPVGSRFIESLARPGGNTTGFTNFESSMGSKWLELLKEVSPRTTRVPRSAPSGDGCQHDILAGSRSRGAESWGGAENGRRARRSRDRAGGDHVFP